MFKNKILNEEEIKEESELQPLYENEYESGDDDVVEIPPPTTDKSNNKEVSTEPVYNGPTRELPLKAVVLTGKVLNGPLPSAPMPLALVRKPIPPTTTVQTRNGAGLFGHTSTETRAPLKNAYPRESFFNSSTAGVRESHAGNAYLHSTRPNPLGKAPRPSIPSLASTARSRSPGFPPIIRNNRLFYKFIYIYKFKGYFYKSINGSVLKCVFY